MKSRRTKGQANKVWICSVVVAAAWILTFSLVQALTINSNSNKLRVSGSSRPSRIPLKSSKLQQEGEEAVSSSCSSKKVTGLYVHIPYCRRRCRYCNFSIVPIGPNAAAELSTEYEESKATATSLLGFQSMDRNYRKAVLKELDLIAPQNDEEKNNKTSSVLLESIYFGGGTPSLAPIETIESILQSIASKFRISSKAEITMEIDPGTFSRHTLQAYKELGVNRISLGVQSFHDTILEGLGRTHRRKNIEASLELLQDVYGDELNYSMDLISGLPGLSLELWDDTLEHITSRVSPRPNHLSIYDLQVESGTVFGKWYGAPAGPDDDDESLLQRQQHPDLPSEEECAYMYKYAAGYLRAKGYEHYEVSSYARDRNYRSRHNQIYWDVSGQWYAVGLGATSFVNGVQQARPSKMSDYIQWVEEQNIAEDFHSHQDQSRNDVLPESEYLTDVIMKRLRTCDGLDLNWVENRFGRDVLDRIISGSKLGLDLGLAEITNNNQRLRLVDPDGLLYSNYLISNIFVELDGDEEFQLED